MIPKLPGRVETLSNAREAWGNKQLLHEVPYQNAIDDVRLRNKVFSDGLPPFSLGLCVRTCTYCFINLLQIFREKRRLMISAGDSWFNSIEKFILLLSTYRFWPSCHPKVWLKIIFRISGLEGSRIYLLGTRRKRHLWPNRRTQTCSILKIPKQIISTRIHI